MNLFLLRRRPIMLLEVLIAFALIVLCALPLIYPHVFILRSEKKFVSTVELDHFVNLLFVNMMQKLYQNEIPWSVIEEGKPQPIEESMMQTIGSGEDLPFDGSYRFKVARKKVSKDENHAAYVFDLIFTFIPKKGAFPEKVTDKYVYEYKVVVERKIK